MAGEVEVHAVGEVVVHIPVSVPPAVGEVRGVCFVKGLSMGRWMKRSCGESLLKQSLKIGLEKAWGGVWWD